MVIFCRGFGIFFILVGIRYVSVKGLYLLWVFFLMMNGVLDGILILKWWYLKCKLNSISDGDKCDINKVILCVKCGKVEVYVENIIVVKFIFWFVCFW